VPKISNGERKTPEPTGPENKFLQLRPNLAEMMKLQIYIWKNFDKKLF
jgi:hypothetical protein